MFLLGVVTGVAVAGLVAGLWWLMSRRKSIPIPTPGLPLFGMDIIESPLVPEDTMYLLDNRCLYTSMYGELTNQIRKDAQTKITGITDA